MSVHLSEIKLTKHKSSNAAVSEFHLIIDLAVRRSIVLGFKKVLKNYSYDGMMNTVESQLESIGVYLRQRLLCAGFAASKLGFSIWWP